MQLLPVQPPDDAGGRLVRAPQYIFEPDAETIFAALLPRYVETLIYQPLLETVASFYSAQMVAMRNATDNATDLLDDLTLTYNKARQARDHHPDSGDRRRVERVALGSEREENRWTMTPQPSAPRGRVTQVLGNVVDVEFPADKLPAIYNAVETADSWPGHAAGPRGRAVARQQLSCAASAWGRPTA